MYRVLSSQLTTSIRKRTFPEPQKTAWVNTYPRPADTVTTNSVRSFICLWCWASYCYVYALPSNYPPATLTFLDLLICLCAVGESAHPRGRTTCRSSVTLPSCRVQGLDSSYQTQQQTLFTYGTILSALSCLLLNIRQNKSSYLCTPLWVAAHSASHFYRHVSGLGIWVSNQVSAWYG